MGTRGEGWTGACEPINARAYGLGRRSVCTKPEHGDFLTTLIWLCSKQLGPSPLDAHLTKHLFPSALPSFFLPHHFLPPSLPFFLLSPHPTSHPLSHMCKKRRDKPVRVPPRPPFPSFAWVMTAQSNPPPSPAYACGYGRNAHARSGTHGRLPARRTLPHGCHHQPRCPRSTRPSRLPTRAKATGGLTAERDEQFMVNPSIHHAMPPFVCEYRFQRDDS
jgi:hypothetical protein